MLDDSRLVAFAGSSDLDRSLDFYGRTLGLPLESRDGFACQFRSGDGALRVTLVQEVVAPPYTVLGWAVPDIEEAVRALAEQGVAFQHYDGVDQDELGVWTAPSGARVAWFTDPDGNTLSLTQIA